MIHRRLSCRIKHENRYFRAEATICVQQLSLPANCFRKRTDRPTGFKMSATNTSISAQLGGAVGFSYRFQPQTSPVRLEGPIFGRYSVKLEFTCGGLATFTAGHATDRHCARKQSDCLRRPGSFLHVNKAPLPWPGRARIELQSVKATLLLPPSFPQFSFMCTICFKNPLSSVGNDC